MTRRDVADHFYRLYSGEKTYGQQGGNYAFIGSKEVFFCSDGWFSTGGGHVIAQVSSVAKSKTADDLLARRFTITPCLADDSETKRTVRKLRAALSGK